MPRNWLRRALPKSQHILHHAALRGLGSLLHDPYLLHLNRRSVSLAVFIGLAASFLPLVGQMAIAGALAVLLRANLVISVMLVWISNPLTMPFMFYWNYRVVLWISGQSPELVANYDLDWWLNNIFHIWEFVLYGGILLGLLTGFAGFLLTRLFWRISVTRSWRQRQLRLKLRRPLITRNGGSRRGE